MQPRPSSRIHSLEERASTIEAKVIELSNDTAEELKALRQDIKALDESMKSSFDGIGDAFTLLDGNSETVKATMATKEDLRQLEDRIDHKMTAMEGRINGNIAAVRTHRSRKKQMNRPVGRLHIAELLIFRCRGLACQAAS